MSELEQELERLKRRVEDLERRPLPQCVPMPSYPVDCPHWPYRSIPPVGVPDWTYWPYHPNVTWTVNTTTTCG